MAISILLLLIICMYRIGARNENEDYMSKRQTNAIRGIFACFIFLTHTRQYYILADNRLNMLFNLVLDTLGQLMVVVFFFYSGYGIANSYEKNENYKNTFFKNRIFKTWLHFACAVLMFLLTDLILGIKYPPLTIILSFTGYEAIGNSNWFIFDTLVLYIFTLFSFNCFSSSNRKILKLFISVSVMTVLLIVVLRTVKQSWWYDTVLAYPFGILFYLVKKDIDKLLSKNSVYYITLLLVFILFAGNYLKGGAIFYNFASCFFVLLITMFTYKIKVGNKMLDFIGKYSFYIYIYMRIPMLVLSHLGINENAYLFTAVSAVMTLLIAVVFAKIQKRIDKVVLKY